MTMVITLVIGIIVLYQLFISGVGPTDNTEDNNYDADAWTAYENTRNLAWAAIGLMALGVIVIAAVTILGFVRAGIGGTGRV